MGAYGFLFIDNYPTAWSKNYIDPTIVSFFQQNDIRVFERKISERNCLAFGQDTSEDTERAVIFSNTASNIKQRLEIIGYDINEAEKAFNSSKDNETELIKNIIDQFNSDIEFKKRYREEIKLINNSSFVDFINALNEIIKNKWISKDSNVTSDPLTSYMLKHNFDFSKFPLNIDLRCLVRVILEGCSDDYNIEYDITDLIEAGYVGGDVQSIYCDTINEVAFNYQFGEKIVILAEGSTDIDILKQSLELLYPHLKDYYSFMDFHNSNAAGSASALVTSIKSLIGVGIRNRIIAIFDNDTAAECAMKGLRKINIPYNFRILKLPDLILAENYPTVGPGGISDQNINGLACSIELYFGQDILLHDNSMVPIQWKGFNEDLDKYQGEILMKDQLQKKFFKKIAQCKKDRTFINKSDWSSMEQIFSGIFTAFKK